MVKIKKFSIFTITNICLTYIGISSIFPIISGLLGKIDIYICFLLDITMIFIALLNSRKCFRRSIDPVLLIFFLVLSIVIPYIVGNSVLVNRYAGILFFLTAPLIFQYYKNYGKEDELRKIAIIILVFSVITYITTVVGLITTSPYLSRSIKSSGEATYALKAAGVGGYEFIYFCVLLGIASFYCFWQSKKRWGLIGFGLAFAITILSNYMTAVFLLAIGCVLCLLLGKCDRQRLIVVFLIVLAVLLSDAILSHFASFVQVLSPSGRISRFFAGTNDGIIGSIINEFIIDRIPLISKTWSAIQENSGVGLIFFNSSDLSMIGQHSFVLDTIAVFGIPLSVLYLYLFFEGMKQPKCCIISFVILAFINNITNSLAVALYFVIPVLVKSTKRPTRNPEVQYEHS